MPFTWAYEPALHSSYRPVTEITLAQDLPITFHWAAPLSQMMSWRHPKVIELIKEGLSTGVFELMGSAYAQNVMEATSEWANREQITHNKDVLEKIYGIVPRGFWNPERVWNDSFAGLIMDFGFDHTVIERRILEPLNPEQANRLYSQRVRGKKLTYLPDDQEVLRSFDSVIWSGEMDRFIKLMEAYVDQGKEKAVYAQDTEAIGFWQIAHNKDPRTFQQNFKKLLGAISDNSWIEVVPLSEMAMGDSIVVEGLVRGQASWMEDSVKEDGYKDYFAYLAESPEIRYYRTLHMQVEKKLRGASAGEVTEVAKQVYLKSQFEFGCAPGSMGGDHTRYLLNVPGQMTWESLRYAERLLSYKQNDRGLEWMNFHGHPLVRWQNDSHRLLLSPYGGRVVELISNGKIISPSPYFYNRSGAIHELDHPSPRFRFPEYGTTMDHGGSLFEDRMDVDGKKWGTLGHVETIYSIDRTMVHENSLPHTYYNTQVIPFIPEVKMWRRDGDITLQKRLHLSKDIRIDYRISSREEVHCVNFSVTNELSPSPMELLNGGKIIVDGSSLSHGGTTCTLDLGDMEVIHQRAVFAHRVVGLINWEISPENPLELSISLNVK